MSSDAKLLAAVAVLGALAVGCWLWWPGDPEPFRSAADAPPAAPAEAARAEADLAGPDVASPEREAVAPGPGAEAEANAVAAAAPPATMRGRLLDVRGQGLAGVPLELRAFELGASRVGERLPATTESDLQGGFELALDAPRTVVAMAGEGHVTLRTTPYWPGREVDVVVVAAPAGLLKGRVVDTDGAPLAEARVLVPTLLLPGFPLALDHAFAPQLFAGETTGADGRFELAANPLAPGLDLLFLRAGYGSKRVPCLEGAGGYLEVTLTKLTAVPGRITGYALDAAGRPVADAELRLGSDQQAQSAADGSFTFEFPTRPATLLAMRPGYRPVVREGVDADTPMPLLVELGAEALGITGVVLDAEGAGVPGLCVNVADPEANAARTSIERLSTPGHTELPRGALARTDEEGKFSVTGLLDRDYRLRAWDEKTALSVESGPIRAGSRDVVLRLPAEPFLAELSGIVVDRGGRAVAGAFVSAYLVAATQGGVALAHGPRATTAADGRFTLRRVPRRHVLVAVSGDRIDYSTRPIEECEVGGALRIEVLRLCRVQLEGEAGLYVCFLDEAGERLSVQVKSHSSMMSGNGWRLRAEKSPVVEVPETAVTLTWSRDDEELGRKPIALDPVTAQAQTIVVAR